MTLLTILNSNKERDYVHMYAAKSPRASLRMNVHCTVNVGHKRLKCFHQNKIQVEVTLSRLRSD